MHYPERWGYLWVTLPTKEYPPFSIPYAEKQKEYLWLVFYKQKGYFEKKGRYAKTLQELGLSKAALTNDPILNTLTLYSSEWQFTVTIFDGTLKPLISLNDEGLIQTFRPQTP